MSIVVNKNNGLDITLGKGHVHRPIVTVLPAGSDTRVSTELYPLALPWISDEVRFLTWLLVVGC